MLEQQIKLLESYLRGEDVDPQALIDAGGNVFHCRHLLESLEFALGYAYTGNKEKAEVKFQEFNECIEEYSI